ncbi:MAG: hypothetical protein L0211_16065 [Planctomycetaceae bacterium]|nr:hypothetical protein [Planctomycetaceae bacterium]
MQETLHEQAYEDEILSGESPAYETYGESLYESPLGEIFQEAGLAGEGPYQEYGHEVMHEDEYAQGEVSDEALAYEFVGLQSEDEIDRFLGRLVRRAARGVRNFANSAAGKAIGGILKKAAGRALPLLGRAAGTFLGGPLGGQIGAKLGGFAGQALGLELQGLSAEDRDLEISRRFVQFATDAARTAAHAPAGASPLEVARGAAVSAARKYYPGLLRPTIQGRGGAAAGPAGARAARGQWVRKGRVIILYGA